MEGEITPPTSDNPVAVVKCGQGEQVGRRERGPAEWAQVKQWLEAEGQTFNPPSSALVFQLAFAPRIGLPQDPALIEKNEGKLGKVLDVYERQLGESRFLAGEEFSLVDLSHLPNTHYLVSTDRGHLLTSQKHVGRWWEEISARPSWKKIVEMQKAPPPA